MLIVLLVALGAPSIVNAACGTCVDSHSCVGESVFQICYDGVRDQTINYTCPDETPICTTYNVICLGNSTDVKRGCGDISNCGVCSGSASFACTSRTTFALCNNGVVSDSDLTCANDYVCSVAGAASGNPCISRCDSTDSDICDRILETDVAESTTASATSTATTSYASTTESSAGTTTTGDSSTGSTSTSTGTTESPSTGTTESPSTGTTGDSSTGSSEITSESTVTVTATTEGTVTTPAFNEVVYCQGINSTGRYPIPNDTVCTSFIYCVLRSGSWTGLLYNCPPQKPYFDADIYNCGTVKPDNAGCTNLV
ncbi:hypothetical protein KR084_004877 [Drosophila pseudotakahashii]|nr:hypothetical protein KR084_004877 [Drosophila pseudotakahashii]